ncbi:MAG: DNA primase DnaG [Candidatus Nanoarchaeia archaeon]|nr:DNA primase DnaG [Candidatus Nanoarchaeia archaeon]MDD4563676.1 DNA primase DnaG [Candidatus Nanoarchaeia archaeon]
MAKISPSSIKYSIIADFVADGPFQKPDVIGAIFGQTEGLLGSDMELRELQKNGKIGRVDVDLISENGKTKGEIIIPTALDRTETTIIAASIETIDKIGPTDAKITVREIEDVRGSKRDYIMERAKQLLSNIKNEGMNSREMETELRDSTRTSKIVSYGDEGLAAGPEVESSNEIIVVEGRADVVNLLKAGINNVIGMQGTKLPKTIAILGNEKELTLFVDGDRGGKLIIENVCANARVAYITSAPDGKEVEELTSKEILQALRKKVTYEEYFKNSKNTSSSEENIQKRAITNEDKKKIREFESEIKGKNVLILDENLNVIKNIPISRLSSTRTKNAFILVTSSVTMSIINFAEDLNAKAIAAKTFGRIPQNTDLEFISI